MEINGVPSDRKQVNIRATAEDLALLEELAVRVEAKLGSRPSQSVLYRMGLAALAREYPPVESARKPRKKRGKK